MVYWIVLGVIALGYIAVYLHNKREWRKAQGRITKQLEDLR